MLIMGVVYGNIVQVSEEDQVLTWYRNFPSKIRPFFSGESWAHIPCCIFPSLAALNKAVRFKYFNSIIGKYHHNVMYVSCMQKVSLLFGLVTRD